jgi:hypothetical protein
MTSLFEDRLWETLRQHAEDPGDDHVVVEFPPAPRRRVVNGRRTGAVLTAAAAVGVSFFFVPGGGSPAYAVEVQQGEHVKVSIDDLGMAPADLLKLEDKLRAVGINVVVDATGRYRCGHSVVWPGSLRELPSKDPSKRVVAKALVVSGMHQDSDGRQVAVLSRGDTAFFNVRYAESHDLLVDVNFASGTCTPQSGS